MNTHPFKYCLVSSGAVLLENLIIAQLMEKLLVSRIE
jgi:hypothetical protein